MSEERVYPPSAEFVRRAQVQGLESYRELYRQAEAHPEAFWEEMASREVHWFEKWSNVFEWHPPFVKWFTGGKTMFPTTAWTGT
jgi:acetyl-CoA synthetase